MPAGPDQRYADAMRGRTAFVYIDRPPGGFEADTVLLDDAGGARQAVEHLLARGHRRIACVADRAEVYTARERVAGYEAALAAAGIDVDPELIRPGSPDAPHAETIVTELLDLPPDRRPSAVFTANNRNTIGALHALAGRDDEIALVGFDDFELADLLGITVVRADAGQLGARAAALAFARLDGDERPPQRVTIPTDLIVRGSGERRDMTAAPLVLPPNQFPRFYAGGARIDALRGRRGRRGGTPGGLDRLDDDGLRRGIRGPQPRGRRPARARPRARRAARRCSDPSTCAASAPIRGCSSSCSTRASACRSTCTPAASSPAPGSARPGARPRPG